jgi:hypothetical protein
MYISYENICENGGNMNAFSMRKGGNTTALYFIGVREEEYHCVCSSIERVGVS